jgi:hypothetical protein
MDTMFEPFKFNGQYTNSSAIPTITVDGKEIPRVEFWKQQIDKKVAEITANAATGEPVYIATGGGYGSYNALVAYEKSKGAIGADIPSIKGDLFRNLPEFEAEKDEVRKQIRAHLGEEKLKANPNAVEQTLSAFYSDEVNTRIGKEVVKAATRAHQSSIYESASIYNDTVERAKLAEDNGVKAVLVAGDRDMASAIAELKHIEPANTATSYKKFADRFKNELVPLFDEVRLYNTDGKEPMLIAQKKGKGEELEILKPELYAKFLAKAVIDPKKFESPTAGDSVILEEHKERDKAKEPEKDTKPPEQPRRGNVR